MTGLTYTPIWQRKERKLDDFAILIGILASGSIAINLYLVKAVANLCQRISHLEGQLSKA